MVLHILVVSVRWFYTFGCSPLFKYVPGRVAQSVTYLTADPGIAILIPGQTFTEIDHETRGPDGPEALT